MSRKRLIQISAVAGAAVVLGGCASTGHTPSYVRADTGLHQPQQAGLAAHSLAAGDALAMTIVEANGFRPGGPIDTRITNVPVNNAE